MANDMKIFLTDDILAEGLNQQILARNFQAANNDLDGSTMKKPFKSTMNVMELLTIGDDLELTIVSDRASILIQDGVVYLDYIGAVALHIFPKNGNLDEGIRLNLEIYAKDGVDLAYALGEGKYDTIFLGEGIYPGMVVNRPVRILGCGLATIVIPYDEYKNGYNANDYRAALANAIAKAEGLGLANGMVPGNCCGDDLDFTLGLGLGIGRPCNESPMVCANAYANAGAASRILGNGCGLRTNNKNRYYNNINCGNVNLNCAVIRVTCDDVYVEDISIVSVASPCDILIGLAFASKTINTRIVNVGAARVAIALDNEGLGAIGMYAANCDNIALVDGMVDIGDGVDAAASIAICNVAQAKLDGLLTNARLFVGDCGCHNQIDFASGITIIEDSVAIEGNGATLKYGELPAGDVEGAVKAIYLGSMMKYAILVNVAILGCH